MSDILALQSAKPSTFPDTTPVEFPQDAAGNRYPGGWASFATTSGSGAWVFQIVSNDTIGHGFPIQALDGALVSVGTTTQTKATDATTASWSVIQLLKGIFNALLSGIGVTGTFWQAVQPVSGSVTVVQGSDLHIIVDSGSLTANAGTNLNTSALAVESGGNLATVAGAVVGGKVQSNTTQIGGVAPTMGNGATTTGTQRFTLASDSTGQVALAAGSATIGALTAHQSTNIDQWNGNSVDVNNGATDNGTVRVTISSDSTGQVKLAAGTNVIGHVIVDSGTITTVTTVSTVTNLSQMGGVAITLNKGSSDAGTQRVTLGDGAQLIGQVAPAQGTYTDGSGTITTGGTAQTVFASNASRKEYFIQNNGSGPLWVNFTTTAVQSQPSIQLLAGQVLADSGSFVSTELISIIGATTGAAFTAKQA